MNKLVFGSIIIIFFVFLIQIFYHFDLLKLRKQYLSPATRRNFYGGDEDDDDDDDEYFD